MPHILLVSATSFEIQPLMETYSIVTTGPGIYETFINERDRLSVLLTGVGMVNTAYQLGRLSEHYYDHVINAGVCGSFKDQYAIGDVVRVFRDELCEMGAEDGDQFIRYSEMGLGGTNIYNEKWATNIPSVISLQRVAGITVNKVHGNVANIEKVKQQFKPDVESMEGAAFFSGCQRFREYVQVRAVSNKVEKRDKSKWNMPLAISNLNQRVLLILEELFHED